MLEEFFSVSSSLLLRGGEEDSGPEKLLLLFKLLLLGLQSAYSLHMDLTKPGGGLGLSTTTDEGKEAARNAFSFSVTTAEKMLKSGVIFGQKDIFFW